MAKQQISARQLVSEIVGGASDQELMLKYNVPAEKLQSWLDALVAKGLLNPRDLEGRDSPAPLQKPENSARVLPIPQPTGVVPNISEPSVSDSGSQIYNMQSKRIPGLGSGFEITSDSGRIAYYAIKKGFLGVSGVELYSAISDRSLIASARKRGVLGWQIVWEIFSGDLLLGKWEAPWLRDAKGGELGWLAVQHSDFARAGCLAILLLPVTIIGGILLIMARLIEALFGGEAREVHMLLGRSYLVHITSRRPFFGKWRCKATFRNGHLATDEIALGLMSAVLFTLKEL